MKSSFCLYYHEKTKYTPAGIAQSGRQIDWHNQPVPYKTYTTAPSIDLKPYLPGKDGLDPGLRQLSQLLYLTYGVSAVVPYPDKPLYMRTAPSAGGLYPAEIYLVSRGSDSLAEGIYNYHVPSHTLVHFWEKPAFESLTASCFKHPALVGSDLALVITGVFLRSQWRYEDRAYRRICLDTGHLLGNLTLAASLSTFDLHLIGGFHDQDLAELLFLDSTEEAPFCVAALAHQNLPHGQTVLPSLITSDYPKLGAGQLLAYLHQASNICQVLPLNSAEPAVSYNFPFGLKIATETTPLDWQNRLPQTIMHRRSTRQYTAAPLTCRELLTLLHFTYQPQAYADQGLNVPDYFDLSLLETFITVTAVEGLEEGCYYYAPQAQELRQIRFKNFRREVHYLCLGQDLGRDAGATVFHTADLATAVARYGERAYRYLHMDAGQLGQRLNLAALHLGLGVSGIAGFFDDQVNEVLGIPEQEAVLYITTLGRPASNL